MYTILYIILNIILYIYSNIYIYNNNNTIYI